MCIRDSASDRYYHLDFAVRYPGAAFGGLVGYMLAAGNGLGLPMTILAALGCAALGYLVQPLVLVMGRLVRRLENELPGRLKCRQCERPIVLRTARERLASTVRCPSCGTTFRVTD